MSATPSDTGLDLLNGAATPKASLLRDRTGVFYFDTGSGPKLLYDLSNNPLKENNDPMWVADGWKFVSVRVDSNNQLYLCHYNAKQSIVSEWKVDINTGRYQSHEFGANLTSAELNYNLDLNDDGIIGENIGVNINGYQAGDTISGTDLNDHINGKGGNDNVNGGSGNDVLIGDEGDDQLNGGSRNDEIYAGNGNDVVNAGEGDDLIVGGDGAGNDSYEGGLGADAIKYTSAKAAITVDLSKGSATSTAGKDCAGIGSDVLFNIENIIAGNYNDTIKGNNADNVLDGGAGADSMAGGAGNDTYIVDTAADTVTEVAAQGTDTVRASVSYTLGANLENLTLTGTAANGTGNAAANSLTGNSANNVLDGKDGRDSLTGQAGADTFLFSTKPIFGLTTADHITDFTSSQGDRIQISRAAFGIASNATASLTTVNTANALTNALGSSSLFVYDSRDGSLYWNQNGSTAGFGTGGIFAVIDNQASLKATNISLI